MQVLKHHVFKWAFSMFVFIKRLQFSLIYWKLSQFKICSLTKESWLKCLRRNFFSNISIWPYYFHIIQLACLSGSNGQLKAQSGYVRHILAGSPKRSHFTSSRRQNGHANEISSTGCNGNAKKRVSLCNCHKIQNSINHSIEFKWKLLETPKGKQTQISSTKNPCSSSDASIAQANHSAAKTSWMIKIVTTSLR